MSLNAQEQRVLDLIKDGLTGSDSGLAAMLGTFNRLASGEEMPAREKIRPGSREAAGCPGRWAAPLLWLAITLSLITVGLVFSRIGSPSKCAVQLAMVCSHSDTAHSLYPAVGNGS